MLMNKDHFTSLELVELINQYRQQEGNRGELLHKDFLRVVRGVISKTRTDNFKEYFYIDSKNEKRPCFITKKEGVKLLIDSIRNSDKIPLQKVYEEMGGQHSLIVCVDRFEDVFFRKLEDALLALKVGLQTQFSVLSYRLDGYLPEYNIAIEYDEAQHFIEPQKSKDAKREEEVVEYLGCKIVRLDYRNTDAFNIGLVVSAIWEMNRVKETDF